jgi:hypothetical protein
VLILKPSRIAVAVAASVVCALGAVSAARAAPAGQAAPPGANGPTLTLMPYSQQYQFTGGEFDTTADAAGNTYIGWLADTTPGTASKAVHLCTIKPAKAACSGGTQTIPSEDMVEAADLNLLPGSKSVTMVWFANTAGGEVLKSVSQAGAKASSPAKIASAPANGELFDAVIGPSGHVWTVTGDVDGTTLGVHAEGSTPPSPPTAPWAVGFAQIAFTGSTAVLVIQQAGTLSVPDEYSSLTGSKWSAFKPLTGTESAGYAPGLTTTSSGLRVVTVSQPDFYHPVVASWQNGAFGPAKLLGDSNDCAPDSAGTTTDASGRLADITNECGQITIDNLPKTTKAAVARFASGGTVAGSTPRLATLPSGRGWAVFALQSDQTDSDELLAVPVLLPALRTNVTGDSTAGDVTVTGPVSCLPVVSTTVAVSAAPASGWHTTSTSLTLDGTTQPASLDGSTLTPGKSYTLAGTASFADGSKKQTATVNLAFKACPAP